MKQILVILTVALLTIGIIITAFGFQNPVSQMNNNFYDYDKSWSEVDSLEKIRQVQTAQKKVEEIYTQAKKDKNDQQIVKSVFYKARYQTYGSDDAYNSMVNLYKKELEVANPTTKAIFHSLLGTFYSKYLDNNRWKLRNVTTTDKKPNPDDIETWSAKDLTAAAFEHFKASIQNKELADLPIEDFEILIKKGENKMLRPTLFDVLGHRALDFFTNERSYLNKPADKFELDNAAIFGDVATFVSTKFEQKESLSEKYETLLLFQTLLDNHKNDGTPAALVDTDLKRLKYVKNHAIIADKDELYLNALNTLKKKYKKDEAAAEIAVYIGNEFYKTGQKYDKYDKEQRYKWDWKRAFEEYEEAIRDFPDSYGGKLAQYHQARLMQKNLTIGSEKVNVPDQNILTWIEYRNVPKVYFKIVMVDEKTRDSFRDKNRFEELVILNNLPIYRNWVTDLPSDGDLHTHRTEIKIDGLPNGEFYVLASDNEYFSSDYQAVAMMFLRVSNLSYFSKSRKNGLNQFYVVDRMTGKPLGGVTAEFYRNKYNSLTRKYKIVKIGEAISSNDGKVSNPSNEKQRYYIKLRKDDDYLSFDDKMHYEYVYKEDTVSKTASTEFFLDRAIYRPGQTVYFKGLLLEKNYKGIPKIIANQKVTVKLYDANYQVAAEQEFTSNEFGTFNGSFKAPQGGLLGQMYLQSSYGTHSNNKYFRVEEYKRPKFEVKFDELAGSFKLNETINVTGQAKAYAGNNIDNAKVTYRVVRNVSYPYWRWWWGYPPTVGSQEIAKGETVTDTNGQFKIDFTAIPDYSQKESSSPQFNYEVSVDVIDITGETHSQTTNVSVGYIAMKADVMVAAQVDKANFDSVVISTQNLNGAYEAAKGLITIYPLKAPNRVFKDRYWEKPDRPSMTKKAFYASIPSYAYSDENEPINWEEDVPVLIKNFDTDQSKAIVFSKKERKKLKAGQYKIILKTQDKFGKAIEVIKIFEVFDLKAAKVPDYVSSWFHTENKAYEPGETAPIYFGSAYYRSFLLYEIYDNERNLIRSEWVVAGNIHQLRIPILESYRGNIGIALSFVTDNRSYNFNKTIAVPWTNKDLTIEYETFRDKLLPGQKEEWRIKISGNKKEKVAAEVVAAMYDQSLDAFAANNWFLNPYPSSYPTDRTDFHTNFSAVGSSLIASGWQPNFPYVSRSYPKLNLFNIFNSPRNYGYMAESRRSKSAPRMSKTPAPAMSAPVMEAEESMDEMVLSDVNNGAFEPVEESKKPSNAPKEDVSDVKVRTNLNETVFFKPELKTDEEGNLIINFTMNEALTRWKFLLFAHTKDLSSAVSTKQVVTQKDLMVQPNPPRFFRENDEIHFTAKVSNLSEGDLTGTAELQLFDALSMKRIDVLLKNNAPSINFDAKKGQSAPLSWKLNIPDSGLSGVLYRVVAKAGKHSDGEENALPVLTDRMLITETMPMSVRGGQTKDFTFKAMEKASKSASLKHHKATLEFTSNPAWYAVQALPYLMEYPYECTEQVFSRYYANSLAASVTSSQPKIKSVFEKWKNTKSEALQSNLSKNQDLKYALLEETPWVLAAQNEATQKQNIGLLFDLTKMENELSDAMKKIQDRQLSNGGFAWFPGGKDSWYITQYIVEGMGHLKHLGVNEQLSGIQNLKGMDKVLANAVKYTDDRIVERYERLEKRVKKKLTTFEENQLSYLDVHFLYTRSFYPEIPLSKKTQKVHDYFMGQAKKYWMKHGLYSQGMLALALNRGEEKATADLIVKGLRETSADSEELGMHWKYDTGYYWYLLPIETHAMMIEVFSEIAKDEKAVNSLKLWMLKNKQTTHWKTTKATSAAVYALLMNGDNWLLEDQDINITIGGDLLDQSDIQKEAGTGHFKVDWKADEVKADMANIKIKNPNKSPAWGAMYWQYFEDYDKIKSFEDTPLKIVKTLYKEVVTDEGLELQSITENSPIKVGDKLKVRIELRVDRAMEYVHLKDMRASGFEPINVMSQYKWQAGLGYYESTRDAATNFFISYLPKGTYVFEYPMRAIHKGDFSNGITTLQCMYAPEFTSHSEGIRVKVK
ncbi:MAG: alpha-2-macroglobulin family protein [Saprospiraceae bacterium]